jgi:tRNA(Ile)-lysidine synthase
VFRLKAVEPDLAGRTFAALDRRLEASDDAPVALALSGGGDSVALLELAADWTSSRGRRLLCLTVDHRIQPESAGWSGFAADTARSRGADWRGLAWTGPKPQSGVQAAARGARHRLIAEAARGAGAKVVLFAHTLDDRYEAAAMRAEGTAIGNVCEWSPSPVWPEGRDVFLLRPLLGTTRAELRQLLLARGRNWIEDPANDDPKYARARVRLNPPPLAGGGLGGGVEPHASRNPTSGPLSHLLPQGEEVRVDAAGVITAPREPLSGAFVAAALLCASGTSRPPRGDRLKRLMERLRSAEAFTATLCGARIEADRGSVRFMRDAGETTRGGLAAAALAPGVPAVWDGRFEITADDACEARPLKGLAARLGAAERAWIAEFAPAARAALPVLVANPALSPRLAFSGAEAHCLVEARLRGACGLIAHERDVAVGSRGAVGRASLSWGRKMGPCAGP